MLPFRRIFHPTDFSANDSAAFAHALKLACLAKAELTIMHVDPEIHRDDFEDFPRVRPLLVRWGVLAEGSSKQDVASLGIGIRKIRAVGNPVTAILAHLSKHPTDLLVLSTHQREGLARLTHGAVAEPVARQAHTRTLFVPADIEGFVSATTGAVDFQRVLLPVAHAPAPQPAVDLAAEMASALGNSKVLFEMVHIGREEDFPKVRKHEQPGWTWERLVATGDPVNWILATGKDFDVDLIVMMTEGHHGVLDELRGSTTERVLRSARCPLLAIPA